MHQKWHSLCWLYRKMPAGIRQTAGRDVRVYTALHTVQVCTYTVEVHMGPIVKNGLSAFDWSHTDFRTVADLQTWSIDSVNTDVAVPYPCGRFPVLLLRIGTTCDDFHLD